MRRMYDRFPEMLFVAAKYKLNDMRMPVCLFLVEDGNGESEIVAVWMVVDEDAVSITHPLSCLLYTSPSPRDATLSRMPSSA